ncbi:MAG: glycosyltransferase [Nanobdellota archaeon]
MDFFGILSTIAILGGLFTSIVYLFLLFKKDPEYKKPKNWPSISVIIPVWNEGSNNGERMRKTIDSLLKADYPKDKLDIIIVDDASTDNSLEIAKTYKKYGIKILSNRKSKGKTLSVNKGIKIANGDLVVALDADSFIMPDVLKKLASVFQDKNVMAVIPSIKIWNPKSILEKIQFYELLSAVFIRYLQSKLGAISLAPGAFTLIRKDFVKKYGLLNHKTMVEDLEMSLRIQSENYIIENIVDANVYTSGVSTWKAFLRQRLRWYCGFIIQTKKYAFLISRHYGNLGFFVLPSMIFFIILMLVMFLSGLVRIGEKTIEYINELLIIGFQWPDFEFFINPFFLDINNRILLPILLLIISIIFAIYIKIKSKEKQNVILPYIIFLLTYWVIGPICWLIAIYYRIRKKKIKWGPNYFID